MAYCVNCGVKLESGTTECPLCHTKVVAPPEVIGNHQEPLFPTTESELTKYDYQRLDKNRKGIIELVIAFMGIAVVTLVITAFALGTSFSPWLPIASVVLGGSYILVLLFVQATYTKITSWFVAITIVLLTIIDLDNGRLDWSLYANLSVALYWLIGVMPWMFGKKIRNRLFIVSASAVALFLLAIDFLDNGVLQWSVTVALPTYAIVLIAFAFLFLRIRFGKPSMTDIVLSVILGACWGVVAGDFFHLRSIGSQRLLSWSSSVFIVAVCLLIFLTLNVTVRRVRNYFNNRVV